MILNTARYNNHDKDCKIQRESTYKAWAQEGAEQMGVAFVDVNETSAAKLDRLTPEQSAKHYMRDPVHYSELGARRNAQSVAEGLKKLKGHPLRKLMK